jgi:glycerol kinase
MMRGDRRATLNAAAPLKGVEIDTVAALGITNQRETSLIWDKKTGAPLHNAIVWQDRREVAARRLGRGRKRASPRPIAADPYFSATKLEWLLKNVKGLKGKRLPSAPSTAG